MKEPVFKAKQEKRVKEIKIKKPPKYKETRQPKQNYKIDWPNDEELQKAVFETPSSILAKKLGVSDVAITKRCKKRGIKKPGAGYWAKLSAEKVRGVGLEPTT